MANEKNICCICGKEYDVCYFCPEVANFTPWRRICDTSDHYKIYLTISEYKHGIITKKDAVERFKQIGLQADDCKDFKPNIYNIIKEIFKEKENTQTQPTQPSLTLKKDKVYTASVKDKNVVKSQRNHIDNEK